MPDQAIVLGHLSDIHFGHRTGDPAWDEDSDLRNELEADLARVVQVTGAFRGLVVTGDIAFSAERAQYGYAAEWLAKVCAIVGCREVDVWLVPGNHDVQRAVVSESRAIQDFHRLMRSSDLDALDDLFYSHLVADSVGGDAYLEPLSEYNAFAVRYECAITAAKPYWEDSVPIGDSGYSLRLRGLTSPLISDRLDDPDGNRLVLGRFQAVLPRKPGTVTMTLSHHPLTWLRDGEAIDDLLRTRAQIQLWGHRHAHRARVMDGNVHLFAGAVHPQRATLDWEPRYNVMRIEMPDPGPDGSLTLFPRVWRRQEQCFGPDFQLDGTDRKIMPLHGEPTVEPLGGAEAAHEETAAELAPSRDARRVLAFAFSSLPYQRRLAVARDLALLDEATRGVPDQELFEMVLGRALRENKLANLWSSVETQHGRPNSPNPFGEPASDGG